MPIHRSLVLSDSQHVRVPILHLRGSLPGEHLRSIIPDEPIFRRGIPQLRIAGIAVLGGAAGGARGSHGLRVSSRHQVSLLQVWCFGNDTATRFPLHSTVKHRQREDVYLHLVLVHHSVHHVIGSDGVQSGHHLCPGRETETVASLLSAAVHRNLLQYQQKN